MEMNVVDKGEILVRDWRMSSENLLPQRLSSQQRQDAGYNIYPYHSLGSNRIYNGYTSLAEYIISQKTVIIDGFQGTFWDIVRNCLELEFEKTGLSVNWINIAESLKSEEAIESIVQPFLGEKGSVWGRKGSLNLADLFDAASLQALKIDKGCKINIVYGTGAALLDWDASVIYLDVPKNEVQYRMRAGAAGNFATSVAESQQEMYKRCFFVDWPLLNQHKQNIINRISIIADAQWRESLNWAYWTDMRSGLGKISRSVFRARPWFEAGAWGGNWMKDRIEGLNKDEINYAWSFELISPENGLVFESDANLLEISFDFIMFTEAANVLGKHEDVFGTEFPIRFDFLDTFDGGNLSIQCHPSLDYIRKEFGEKLTQDETYYMLDCKPGARVYLGFQEDIDPARFERALIHSQENSEEIDIEEFVQTFSAKKHELFLIPNGTVHSSGINNMVLEISATPYIFTFKMYDWMQMGLDGKPRPINIEHAFKNLNFDRKGDRVTEELISVPSVIESGADWQLVHLPTHAEHFYDLHRIEFESDVEVQTENTAHILMLVEGSEVILESADGTKVACNYAETFVVPAAAGRYKLINRTGQTAKVVKAFVKDDRELLERFKNL